MLYYTSFGILCHKDCWPAYPSALTHVCGILRLDMYDEFGYFQSVISENCVHYYICGKGRCIIGAETIEKSQVCEHKVYQQTD